MADNTMVKRQKDKKEVQNTIHKTNDRATRTPLKTVSELMCSGYLAVSALHVVPVM